MTALSREPEQVAGATRVEAPPAFADAYAQEVAFVWRSLRRLGVRERDVEDASQEAWVIAHAKWASFDGRSLRGWLFAIAVRVAADHRKKAHVRREVLDAAAPEPGAPEGVTAALDEKRARAMLDEIIDGLDDEKRAVFVLFEMEQLAMTEVATMLGCPLQTAYSRLHAARAFVEKAIGRMNAQRTREEGS
ncbi:MAG TPA: sigma-70 family RNA polymerase sigma factor [Polyangiaceae bacterium]